MIFPTDRQLLGGIADALKDTVLPDLARGSAARKQLQAAIETLRRMAFAAPDRAAALTADNADMAEVLRQIEELLGREVTVIDTATPIESNQALQAALVDAQANIPPDLVDKITPLLTRHYVRMVDRALALIPPPVPRTPRAPA
jgi:hypothetical protein